MLLTKEFSFFVGFLYLPIPIKFTQETCYTDKEIVVFANKIGIHPGVVAGCLQHDHIIAQSRCSTLKQQYKIVTM